ncbi:hypothetical protein [Holospora curviuscula]|uniref:Uncharacterized protein n=1 Tax=Holospora curviuscula TaxID=1082868 RepID=A0A2S5R851_9PROT|nr:hypothetical protein [Holospora curviuscula]PPE03480.1 hypothetical protein HCUR_01018 [Holospora curviuscula]
MGSLRGLNDKDWERIEHYFFWELWKTWNLQKFFADLVKNECLKGAKEASFSGYYR